MRATPARYVYLVRSQRTGVLSVGIDLTPHGECAWSCDYCQVPGGHRSLRPEAIEIDRLRDELARVTAEASAIGDFTFAGSGEPTYSPSFEGALGVAIDAAKRIDRRPPVRVLTSGTMLDFAFVRTPLLELVRQGAGEVWVKLDSWDDASMLASAGVRGQTRHEARLARFGREAPVVVQSTLVHRTAAPPPIEVAFNLAGALQRIVETGARVSRVFVSTVLRTPGAAAPISAYSADEVGLVSATIRASLVGIEVVTPAAPSATER